MQEYHRLIHQVLPLINDDRISWSDEHKSYFLLLMARENNAEIFHSIIHSPEGISWNKVVDKGSIVKTVTESSKPEILSMIYQLQPELIPIETLLDLETDTYRFERFLETLSELEVKKLKQEMDNHRKQYQANQTLERSGKGADLQEFLNDLESIEGYDNRGFDNQNSGKNSDQELGDLFKDLSQIKDDDSGEEYCR